MANFKGGFAFNNEAAKVEVEQEADGTLVSCINPVTGKSLAGGENYVETFEGTAAELLRADVNFTTDFVNALRDGNISIVIDMDLTAFSFPSITLNIFPRGSVGIGQNITVGDDINGTTCSIRAGNIDLETGSLYCDSLLLITNGVTTDGTKYASSIPTVTTIYHHPMPE